ncbi:MAG: FUSC family protein [Planctomycetaceae bacterium]|nr:FUSC family protein [Planctomycetaceae bacterium]
MNTPFPPILYSRHAIKTGLACALAYGVSSLLGSSYPVWAVISFIVAMQNPSVAESLQASVQRFTGMALGAIVGIALSLVFTHPENILWIACIIFVVNGAGSYFFRYGARYMLASIAATIVLLVGHIQAHSTVEAATRFGLTLIWEIALGVGLAAAVSMLLWPVRLGDTLKDDLRTQYAMVVDHLNAIARAYAANQTLSPKILVGLIQKLLRNRDRLTAASRHEAFLYNEDVSVLDNRIVTLNRSVTILRILLDALDDGEEDERRPVMPEKVEAVVAQVNAAITRYGVTGSPADPAVRDGMAAAIATCRAAMEQLYHEDSRDIPTRSLVRAVSFFRLLNQLAVMYQPQTLLHETGGAKG